MSETRTDPDGAAHGGTSSGRARTGRIWSRILAALVFAYVFAAGYMYLNQRSFVFVPSGALADPAEKGLENVSVETVPMADGTRVSVWTAAPRQEGAPTVLYFHGNARNGAISLHLGIWRSVIVPRMPHTPTHRDIVRGSIA